MRDRPLLTGTIERLSEIVDPSPHPRSTRARFADAARATLGPVPPENLILKEDPAGPATAFALGIATFAHLYGNAPALIAPSDHLINEEEAFNAASRDMLDQLVATPESMVVLGAEPTRFDRAWATSTPRGATGGRGDRLLHEKPDEETIDELAGRARSTGTPPATAYGSRRRATPTGRPAAHLRLDRAFRPRRLPPSRATAAPPSEATRSTRCSYAGMECLVVPRQLGWTDVGTWPRLERVLADQRVTSIGPALHLDAEDVLVASMDGRPVVTLGARGLIVVTHEDAVYVLDKEKAMDTPTLERLRSLLAASTEKISSDPRAASPDSKEPMSHQNSQHIVVVGTKPDIIKQAPIYHELRNRGHDVVLCHTGQHYDHNLSQSMLDEFGVREDVNLEVRGGVNDLVSGITAKLALYLRGFSERGGFPITYVHGDTTTAMAGSLATFGERQALVHVEAGLRTLSPKPEVLRGWIEQGADLDWASFREQSVNRDSWSKGSKEPSPEQFNTRSPTPAPTCTRRPSSSTASSSSTRASRPRPSTWSATRSSTRSSRPSPAATRTRCWRGSRRWATARSSASACTAGRTRPTVSASTC